jgi:hydroxyacylglutathione hydrolase
MLFKTVRSDIVSYFDLHNRLEKRGVCHRPRRDCEVCSGIAEDHGIRIREIFETHRNEDNVVGSRELYRINGARIHHGPGLPWTYGETLHDGEDSGSGH